MKKTNKCSARGFKALRESLIAGEEHKCPICDMMLEEQDFKHDELQKFLMEAETGDIESILGQQVAAPPTKTRKKFAKSKGKKKKNTKRKTKKESDSDEEEPDANQDEDVNAAAEKFLPHLTLLSPGAFGKIAPYKCDICKTQTWPEGFVGDCTRWKAYSVHYFLNKHVQSDRHQRALRALEVQGVPREQVECQALALHVPIRGSRLHEFAMEFDLWASFANLESTARHSYSRDLTLGTWIIRSAACEKTTEVQAQLDSFFGFFFGRGLYIDLFSV